MNDVTLDNATENFVFKEDTRLQIFVFFVLRFKLFNDAFSVT